MIGGDPLTHTTGHLDSILRRLRKIEPVSILRIGSIPAYNPYRVLNDSELLSCLHHYGTPVKPIYLMAYFNHPGEVTDVSFRAIEELPKSTVIVVNQTPSLRNKLCTGYSHYPLL